MTVFMGLIARVRAVYLMNADLSARWSPTLKLNQPTWPLRLQVCCYHPCPPSPFIIITHPKT